MNSMRKNANKRRNSQLHWPIRNQVSACPNFLYQKSVTEKHMKEHEQYAMLALEHQDHFTIEFVQSCSDLVNMAEFSANWPSNKLERSCIMENKWLTEYFANTTP